MDAFEQTFFEKLSSCSEEKGDEFSRVKRMIVTREDTRRETHALFDNAAAAHPGTSDSGGCAFVPDPAVCDVAGIAPVTGVTFPVVVRAGTLRTLAGTSGFGASAATNCSTSRLLLCRTAPSRSLQLAGVRYGPIRQTVVSVTSPDRSASTTDGTRRARRAAAIRP